MAVPVPVAPVFLITVFPVAVAVPVVHSSVIATVPMGRHDDGRPCRRSNHHGRRAVYRSRVTHDNARRRRKSDSDVEVNASLTNRHPSGEKTCNQN